MTGPQNIPCRGFLNMTAAAGLGRAGYVNVSGASLPNPPDGVSWNLTCILEALLRIHEICIPGKELPCPAQLMW